MQYEKFSDIDPERAANAAASINKHYDENEKAQEDLLAASIGLTVEAENHSLLGAMMGPAMELIARGGEAGVQMVLTFMALVELADKVRKGETDSLPNAYTDWVKTRERYIFFRDASQGLSELN